MVCGEMLDVLSLLVGCCVCVVWILLYCSIVRMGGVKNAVLLCVERGIMPVLMMATVTIIATSFHLYEKGIGYPPFLLIQSLGLCHLKMN